MERSMPSVAIVIASTGRPTELGRWGDHCARQTLKPLELIYVIAGEADLAPSFLDDRATVVVSAKGSCHQRNAGLAALKSDADIVAFFDDDYIPSSRCIEGIAAAFDADPRLVGASGKLLADGVNSAGISYENARSMVEAHDACAPQLDMSFVDMAWTYGCNMAFRRNDLTGVTFDETLPLYAWQEDVDFSARLRERGGIVHTNAFVGVHQGVKNGRSPGYQLGYSQIANPIYLIGKGTMPLGRASKLMIKNVLSNHLKMIRAEPWIDRRGRAAGNWRAFGDMLTGRMTPERVLSLN
jgi:GT2 family glycosyltransferase